MRIKEVKKLITEQDLLEVNMSPKNLEKLAGQIDARAGMEFEMIVPDVEVDDEGELEPDYDQDESVNDIDDACNFFYDGDYNGRREIQSLRESMLEDYQNWLYEKVDEDWHGGDGFDFFKDYLDREDPFDKEEAEEEARNQLQSEYGDEISPEEFQQMLNALVEEKHEAYEQEQWDEQGRNYDYAREEYESEKQDDYGQGEWLDDQGYRTMQDIASNYDIQWPHWTTGPSEGELSIDDIAGEFSRMIGRPVNASQSYHGARRAAGHYVVEPDGSLEPDSKGDGGLEFVSPPLPLNEMFSDLDKIVAWAKSKGCYTNESTGLHINVSVPNFDMSKLDYVKLALLLGDNYVLDQFGRAGNSYCKSALEEVKKRVRNDPQTAGKLLAAMKNGLEGIASKAIHSGNTQKYTSINTKDNYVEFRSPGGDWLNDDTVEKIKPTLSRFVVALDAACDPDKYKEEYLKKLYQVLQPKGKDDTLSYFAKFAAGELPKQALKSFVRQAQLERKVKAGKAEGKMWWNVKFNGQRIEVVADSENSAKIEAAKHWGLAQEARVYNSMEAEVLRPYTEPPAGSELERIERQAGVGQGVEGLYRIYTTSGGLIAGDEYGSDQAALERAQHWAQRRREEVVVKNAQGQEIGRVSSSGVITQTASSRDEEPLRGGNNTGPYEIYNRETGEAIYHIDPDAAVNDGEALDYLRNYRNSSSRPNEVGVRRRTDAPAQQPAQQNQGNWGIWISSSERFARQPGEYPAGQEAPLRRFSSRDAADAFLAQTRENNPRMRLDVEAREIPSDYQIPPPVGRQVMPQAQQSQPQPQTGGQFTGEWKVLDPEGNEIYRFSGVGNSQSDANRVAIDWLRRNPRHLQNGVEVLPVMA